VIETCDRILPLPSVNQKVIIFDDLVCESGQNAIINYFVNGQHHNCSIIYLSQCYFVFGCGLSTSAGNLLIVFSPFG